MTCLSALGTGKPLVVEAIGQDAHPLPRGSACFYPAAPPLSSRTLSYVAGIVRRHRHRLAHVTETVALLAARSPKLRRAPTDARQAGHAYVVIDGALILIDPRRRRPAVYSGKYRRHGMNLQASLA